MTPQFILRPRAESDIQSAFEWYESQMPGLGEQYLGALREKLEFVREHPQASPVVYRNVRRAVITRFSYLVFYVVQLKRTSVLAVLHHARSPSSWPGRPRRAR